MNVSFLCEYFFHNFPVHIGQPIVPALESEREFGVIDAELVENGGLQVVDVYGILGHVVTDVVG